ncbi:toxin-antitoxin system HicB family antitoxin [Sodalis ligni]|uniref:toxin-antitoxin system HicB family antitoxin n=1 Tax=Sodalis ligni TaxID=2697027 RepID=UPI001BDE4B03|nr:toxin-antitoxin system HicB family antitoxin [Sodalis ligni]
MARDPQINIRLPPDLKTRLQKAAEINRKSVNAYVVEAIEAMVDSYHPYDYEVIVDSQYTEILKRLDRLEKSLQISSFAFTCATAMI